MKKLFLLSAAALLPLSAFAMDSNSEVSAKEPVKSAQKKPDRELLPSEIPAPKKLMSVDGTKFKLKIIGSGLANFFIYGDEKSGATFAGIGTGMQCYLSGQSLKEVMPELRQNALISQKPCSEFIRIDAPNTVEITAGEFRQMLGKFAENNYCSEGDAILIEGEESLAHKIKFALDFSEAWFFGNCRLNYDKKSYEEIAASGEMTDAQLFKFASALLVLAKDAPMRDFYKNELRALFKKAKKEDIPGEIFASAFFTETDPEMR
ncbi:MAG: hypothetical protein IKO42_07025, partial [Opitutales bacterium]|nr:hypothetical protein [Opitutales bacterium]